ncbi:MAG: hypothetical protein RL368_816 [Pseudomonadota bacterium]|jgi:hypothetical protein
MSHEEVNYAIESQAFFSMLNQLRVENSLGKIPQLLWANKLGLLFAARFNQYIHFKDEFIELSTSQLVNLSEILHQSFGIEIAERVKPLLLSPLQLTELKALGTKIPAQSQTTSSLTLIERLKNLLKRSFSLSM